MPIRVLPPILANQIAAGEVVERPASVVKELIENSLDAGANRIEVELEKGGCKLIRIRDNGGGIPKDELILALERHATSKVSSLDDLEAIVSLGFRGEALASISSVSRLTLTSRTAEQAEAWQASAEGRDMAVTLRPAAHPVGTSVDVVDLFFNTPARRRFLRSEKTEFGHIDELLRRLALSRPDVTLTLRHNGKLVRQYRGLPIHSDEELQQRVAAVCGKEFLSRALHLKSEHHGLTLSGWILQPQATTASSPEVQYFYVNGRMMRDRLITHAIRQGYLEALGLECSPSFLLYLTLDPHLVDVNVHPAKHEVRFHESRLVHDFVVSVVRTALDEGLTMSGPVLHQSNQTEPVASSAGSVSATQEPEAKYRGHEIASSRNVFRSYEHGYQSPRAGYQAPPPVTATEQQAYRQLMTPAAISSKQTPIASDSVAREPWRCLLRLRPDVALLATGDESSDLYLVHLPRLAAAMSLSQLSQQWGAGGLVSQPLLMPLSLVLTPEQWSVIAQQSADLTRMGFEWKQHAQKLILYRVPACLRHCDISSRLHELLSLLQNEFADTTARGQVLCRWLSQQETPQFADEQSVMRLFSECQLSCSELLRCSTIASPISLTEQVQDLINA